MYARAEARSDGEVDVVEGVVLAEDAAEVGREARLGAPAHAAAAAGQAALDARVLVVQPELPLLDDLVRVRARARVGVGVGVWARARKRVRVRLARRSCGEEMRSNPNPPPGPNPD